MPETETDNERPDDKKSGSVTFKWDLIVLLLFGFFIRLLAAISRESIGVDSVRYLTFARNYLSGIYHTLGPTGLRELPDIGYPIFIVMFSRAFKIDIESAAVVVSLIAGTITLLLIYMIALRASGHRTALYSLFIASVCLPLIEYSSLVQTESLFIMLLAVAVYISYAATKRGYNTFWFMIGGITSAYAYLTRGIGITFFIIFPLTTWLASRYDGAIVVPKIKSRFAIGLTMFIFGFAIIAIPYMVLLQKTYGKFTLSDQSLWHSPRVWHPEVNFSADPRYDGTLTESGDDYLINRDQYFEFPSVSTGTKIKMFIGKYLRNQIGIYYYHLRELYSPFILILIALGLFALPWDYQFRKIALLMGVWSIPFLILQPLYYTEARYIAPITVFLMVFAGRGAIALIEWFKRMFAECNPMKLEQIFAVVLFILMTPSIVYPLTHRGPKYSYTDLRDAGNFLAGYVNHNEVNGIMACYPVAGYYAGCDINLVLPDSDIDEIIRFAKDRAVRYILLSERKVHMTRPQLRQLLYSESYPDNLELIYDNRDETGYKVRIYRIVEESIDTSVGLEIEGGDLPPPPFYKPEVSE